MAATVVISAVLVGVVGLIVRSIYKDKKNGKSSCGGGCGGGGGGGVYCFFFFIFL